MNVLVTGGSGFIGRYFHGALAAAGHNIRILDLVEPKWDASPAVVLVGDIRDPLTVRGALAGCDAVLHLAAAHHDFGIARETFFSVNELGARVLCAAAGETGVKNIGFFSTVGVYGAAPGPHHEGAPTSPGSPYAESKLLAERIFHTWTQGGDSRRCLVIRPTVAFGPGNYANMYTLIRQVHSGRFIRVGSGNNVKSLAYVANLVDAVLYLWEKPAETAFEIFNYADKPDLNTRQLLSVIYRSLGREPPGFYLPLRLALALALPFDLMIRVSGRNLPISTARIRKMSAETRFESDKILQAGFRPKMTLIEGIERMTRWYLSEGRHPIERNLPPPNLRSQALAGG